MKVHELIDLLADLDSDDLVVLAKDAEGNGFSPFEGIGLSVYVADSTWSGEITLRELTPELRDQGFTEDDLDQSGKGVKAVVLWPVN